MTDPHEINPRKAVELGMERPISRRDFFDGVAAAAMIATLSSPSGRAATWRRDPASPARRT
ncbi:hypothetical protein ACFQX6_39965 [Streptosporangium lutulentum]